MSSVQRLLDIASRIEHLETSAEWIARSTVHSDNAISQTGSMICALADDLRERVYALVKDLEQVQDRDPNFH